MFNLPKETDKAKNLTFGFFQIMVKKEETRIGFRHLMGNKRIPREHSVRYLDLDRAKGS